MMRAGLPGVRCIIVNTIIDTTSITGITAIILLVSTSSKDLPPCIQGVPPRMGRLYTLSASHTFQKNISGSFWKFLTLSLITLELHNLRL